MIWVLPALAGPLPIEAMQSVGVDGALVLEVEQGRARLEVQNLGGQAFVVLWESSMIQPAGGAISALLPAGHDRPDPSMVVAPVEVEAGGTVEVRPVPRAWLESDDGAWTSWATPGLVTVQLAVQGVDGPGTLMGTWRVGGAEDEMPMALPAEIVSVPEAPERMQERRVWIQSNEHYRRQEKLARTLWMTAGGIGLVSGAFAGRSAIAAPNAPETPVGDEASRAELRSATRFYGALGGVLVAVAIPSMVWDFDLRKKRKALGPKP